MWEAGGCNVKWVDREALPRMRYLNKDLNVKKNGTVALFGRITFQRGGSEILKAELKSKSIERLLICE